MLVANFEKCPFQILGDVRLLLDVVLRQGDPGFPGIALDFPYADQCRYGFILCMELYRLLVRNCF